MSNLSVAIRNSVGSVIVSLIDGGYIEIRTGEKPNSTIDNATGALLVSLQLSNPSFGPFSNGVSYANSITMIGSILENGVAGWFRIYNSNNSPMIDGTITQINGGGDMTFDTVKFLAGGSVIIGNGTVSVKE